MKFKILLLFCISTAFTQQCGIRNIFQDEFQLNQTSLLFKDIALESNNNGNQISFYGYVQINNSQRTEHPLIRFYMQPNQNEVSAPATLANIVKLSYNDTQAQSFILMVLAQGDDNFEPIQIPVTLPKSKYLFMAVSIDAGQQILKLYIESVDGANDFSFTNQQVFRFNSLFIRRNIAFDVGCFTDNNLQPSELLKSCLVGRAQNFSFSLNYFEQPWFLAFQNSQFTEAEVYVFDYKDQSNTNNFTAKGTNQIFRILGNQRFGENGQFLAKGNSEIEFQNRQLFDNQPLTNSNGFYVTFKINELNNNIDFIRINDSQNQLLIKVEIIQQNSNYYLQAVFNGRNIRSDFSLSKNQIQRVLIGFFRQGRNLRIYMNNLLQEQLSDYLSIPLQTPDDIYVFNRSQVIDGEVELYQFNIIYDMSGVVYSAKKSNTQQQCLDGCQLLQNAQLNELDCLKCSEARVLETVSLKCQNFCPFNKKNVFQVCNSCQQQQCEELNQQQFQLEKTGEKQYRIAQVKDLANFDNQFENSFQVQVDNLLVNQDYTVNSQIFPQNKSAIYDFNFTRDPQGDITFVPRENAFLSDSQQNLYQKELSLNQNSAIGSKFPILAASGTPSSNTSRSKDDDSERNINDNYKRLGISAFAFFIASMVIGLIGVFYKCPVLLKDWNSFYLQKFIQTFLMGQYIAFWLLYNTTLPTRLYSFLEEFYEYTIQWHKVFEENTKDQYDDSEYFLRNYYRNEFSRFKQEEIYTHFLVNFSFIMILQAFILLLFIIFKGLAVQTKNFKIVNYFQWKIVVTAFLIFTIETLVFGFYNFYHNDFDHRFFIISLIFAILYILIILVLIGFTIAQSMTFSEYNEQNQIDGFYNTKRNTQYIWRGLQLSSPQKLFQGLQYLFYAIFAFMIVIGYKSRRTQIIINFVLLLFWVIFIVVVQPPIENFWKYEQMGVHFILFLAKFLLTIIILDEDPDNISYATKRRIGEAIAILLFFVILWNFLVLLINLLMRVYECNQASLNPNAQQVVMTQPPTTQTQEYKQTTVVHNSNVQSIQPDEGDEMRLIADEQQPIINKRITYGNQDNLSFQKNDQRFNSTSLINNTPINNMIQEDDDKSIEDRLNSKFNW